MTNLWGFVSPRNPATAKSFERPDANDPLPNMGGFVRYFEMDSRLLVDLRVGAG